MTFILKVKNPLLAEQYRYHTT